MKGPRGGVASGAPGAEAALQGSRGEAALQQRWATVRLPPQLITEDGERLRLVFAGTWNHGPGPDFTSARLVGIDGRTLRGDVEVHERPQDWRRHGHDQDPAYDAVLLHVVETTSGAAGNRGPVRRLIVLGADQADGIGAIPATSLPCGSIVSQAGAAAVRARLQDLGRRRLLGKAARIRVKSIQAEKGTSGPDLDQVAYASLLDAVLQVGDAKMTGALARALSWLQLGPILRRREDDTPAARVRARARARADASGGDATQVDDRGEGEVEAVDRLQWTVDRLTERGVWRWPVGAARPGNSPTTRLRIVAALLAKLAAFDGSDAAPGPDRPDPDAARLCAALIQLTQLAEPQAITEIRNPGLIGVGRARQLLVDLCYPLALALAASVREVTRLCDAWSALGAARYGKTDPLRQRLEVGGLSMRPNGCSQSLLALERDYCREGACAICPLARLGSGPSRREPLPSTNLRSVAAASGSGLA